MLGLGLVQQVDLILPTMPESYCASMDLRAFVVLVLAVSVVELAVEEVQGHWVVAALLVVASQTSSCFAVAALVCAVVALHMLDDKSGAASTMLAKRRLECKHERVLVVLVHMTLAVCELDTIAGSTSAEP